MTKYIHSTLIAEETTKLKEINIHLNNDDDDDDDGSKEKINIF